MVRNAAILSLLLLTLLTAKAQPIEDELEWEQLLRTLIRDFDNKSFKVNQILEQGDLSTHVLTAASKIAPVVRAKDVQIVGPHRFPPGYFLLYSMDRVDDEVLIKAAFSPKTEGNFDCGRGVEAKYKKTILGEWKSTWARLAMC
jgi:hypothetical protein